jgi:hypothetical protein
MPFGVPVKLLAQQREHDGPDEESDRGAPDPALLEGVLEQLEGQRGDEGARREGQHRREHPLGNLEPPAD